MIFRNIAVLRENRKIVDVITAKLNSAPVSYRDHQDGIQVNWVVFILRFGCIWKSDVGPSTSTRGFSVAVV